MQKEKYAIKGMTCTACAGAIERQLSKTEGVQNVSVNFATEQMQITYDEAALKSESIMAAVEAVGYEANALTQNSTSNQPASLQDQNPAAEHANEMKQRLIRSLIFTIPLFYLAMGPMVGLAIPGFLSGEKNVLFMALTQLLLTIPVMVIGIKFYQMGFKTLFKGAPNMDSLIAIGTGAAFVYGIFVIYRLIDGFVYDDMMLVHHYAHQLYFESVGVIITLITLGKYLEARSKQKTGAAIGALLSLAPDEAIVLRNGQEITLAIKDVVIGDEVILKPGSKVPVDGIVIDGRSTIDESMLTGESLPVDKSLDDKVIAGTINQTGRLLVKTTATAQDTMLHKIVQMVEDAQGTKAPIARMADQISGIFVPAVLTISVIAFIVWLLLGEPFEFAFRIAVSILVISCPCALGLATPTAIMVGTGQGAKHGVLIKSGEALELMHKAKTVVFDKTGTLTNGKVSVTDVYAIEDPNTMLSLAASLEQHSEHPLSEAIMDYIRSMNIPYKEATDFEAKPGFGLSGTVDGGLLLIGNEKLMTANAMPTEQFKEKISGYAAEGKTPVLVAYNNELKGIIALADTLKEEALVTINQLHAMGVNVVMLTGDHKITATAIGNQLGIDTVIAEVLPDEKSAAIKTLQDKGHKVLMVGDGINDAIALTQADVGLAIGAGTDIAIESADVVLIKNQITDVVTAMELSHSTIRNIKQNLFWAFFYNALGIPIAAGLLYPTVGLLLNPMFAAAAMSFSSVSVVTNALRLKNFKPKNTTKSHNIKQSQPITPILKEEKRMKKTLIVEGMTCGHCSGRVEKTLKEMDGVESASVNLETKEAVVALNKEINDAVFKEAIAEQGYEVSEIRG